MHVAPAMHADQHDVITRDDTCCWCVEGIVICTNGTQTLQQSAPDQHEGQATRGVLTQDEACIHTAELLTLVCNELMNDAANCKMQLHQACLLTFSMVDG